jgi:hypothetical protein
LKTKIATKYDFSGSTSIIYGIGLLLENFKPGHFVLDQASGKPAFNWQINHDYH